MPLYEYECTKCGHRFERIVKFSDAPITKCPKCKGKVEQTISAPAIQFKGSGWYVTDYAKSGSSRPASDGGSGDKAESKAESKSDSKPDSKSDSKTESKTESKSDSKSAAKSSSKPESASAARSDSKKSSKKR